MALPTMSLRASPKDQTLIRDMARALRDRPELTTAIRAVLQGNTQRAATPGNADDGVLPDVLRRVADLEAWRTGAGGADRLATAFRRLDEMDERLIAGAVIWQALDRLGARVEALETAGPAAPGAAGGAEGGSLTSGQGGAAGRSKTARKR